MSVLTTFPFDNAVNYTLDKAAVAGGLGSLDLKNKTALSFLQSFDSSTGFTFDSNLTEFAGGVMRQKDATPANSELAATYASSLNLSWNKVGVTTGVLQGSPTVVAGKLSCAGAQSVTYSREVLAVESFKFKYTPSFTGSPSTNINILNTWNGVDDKDRFHVTISGASGAIGFGLYDSAGVNIIPVGSFASAYSPVAGVEDEIEIVIDSVGDTVNGTVKLFLNGVLVATNTKPSWSRGGVNTLSISLGASAASFNLCEGSFNDLITFNNAQHTVSYTPGYTVIETIYATDSIDIPNFVYSTIGAVQLLNSVAITEVGIPHYTIEGQYWNGSAWAASDGSYLESNTLADINANIASLSVAGETIISMQVVFPDSNTQNSVDAMTVTYTGQEYNAEGSLLTNSSFVAKDMIGAGFSDVVTTPVNTAVKYTMCVNGEDKYHNGSAWVTSDGTFAQANTEAEMIANLDTLLSENSTIRIRIILQTTDQQVTPDIDSLTVQYDFGALDPSAPGLCQVFGFVKTIENLSIAGAVVSFKPFREDLEYREASGRVIGITVSKTTDVNGFFSANLIFSSAFETDALNPMQYQVTIALPNSDGTYTEIAGSEILLTVPDLAQINITDQLTAI